MTEAPGRPAVAAVNVSSHVSRGSTEDVVRDLLPALRQSAASVEADLHAPS
jgi:IclR family transcriptional regulator, pca regulon regulatory protein